MYNSKGKPELFITVEFSTIKIEKLWRYLINLIKEAFGMKTSKVGAMEGLCKK